MVAESFWGGGRQHAFFHVRMFNPFTQSYRNTSMAQCYHQNEAKKRRSYDERVKEVEQALFSPLVFSTAGGMGATATVVYKRIAAMIAEMHEKLYGKTIHWICCCLNFFLLRSTTMCFCGARSAVHRPAGPFISTMDLACVEGRDSV